MLQTEPRRGAAEGREYSGAIEDRDGCTCPSWVRCVHYADALLVISDGAVNHHADSCFAAGGLGGPYVGLIDEWIPCDGCGVLLATGARYSFPDLPAAEAEFERRNLELLGRAE